ncbi:MAG: HEPN domain-containing protein [Cellulosilyticaceae bacterium]
MSNYFALASSDLRYARFGVYTSNDELDLNMAGYHIHQAIEKILKGMLEMQGLDMEEKKFRTHDLDYLISEVTDESLVPETIRNKMYYISRWHNAPRYNINMRSTRNITEELLLCTESWLTDILMAIDCEKEE